MMGFETTTLSSDGIGAHENMHDYGYLGSDRLINSSIGGIDLTK